MLYRFCLALIMILASCFPALAQSRPSECLAIAEGAARVHLASLKPDEVSIAYVGHSTFLIETVAGIRAATDFNGFAGGAVPDVVTMNHAHGSHFTETPDPAIKHVLRGWGLDGKRAEHDVTIADLRIRNVTTDIRGGNFGRQTDGNSIFIFEAAGLCIGHLGHLHHELSPEHMGWIGRLDVVMVPVDGGMTLPVENMMAVLKQIRSRVILPMHFVREGSLDRFLTAARKEFKVEYAKESPLVVSAATLPNEPTVFVLP